MFNGTRYFWRDELPMAIVTLHTTVNDIIIIKLNYVFLSIFFSLMNTHENSKKKLKLFYNLKKYIVVFINLV